MSSKKMNACGECVRNCILTHQLDRRSGSAPVTSFFKVVFCHKYNKHMFLPPKFTASVKKLANQETYLEDAYGKRWTVRISQVDASLAFKRGWNAFFVDHGLQLGDLILFVYLGSHFVARIYDKSGCEKLDFPANNTSWKKRRVEKQPDPQVEPSKSKTAKSSSSSPSTDDLVEAVPQRESPPPRNNKSCQEKPEEYMNDCFFLSDLVATNKQNEDHRPLLDLSDFETNCRILCTNGSEATMIDNDSLSQNPEVGGDKLEIGVPDATQPSVGTIEAKNVVAEETEQRLAPEEPYNLCPASDSAPPVAAEKEKPHTLNTRIREREDAQKISGRATFSASVPCDLEPPHPQERRIQLYPQLEGMSEVKKELSGIFANTRRAPEITPQTNDEVPPLRMELEEEVPPLKMELEAENLAIVPFSVLPGAPIEVVGIAYDPSFIELPSKLACGGRSRKGKKFVTLQDPHERQWPIAYYERRDLNLLISGWRAFYEANEIQPGDRCIFELKNKMNSIYAVSIIRGPALLQFPAP